jgi:hypothetical protein
MCCSSPTPAAPDYSGIASANEAAARYAKEAADNDLAFRRQVYDESRPRQQELYDLASQAARQQMGIAGENEARAGEQWDNFQNTYLPVERQVAADSYGSMYLGDDDNAQMMAILSGTSGLDQQAAMQALRGMRSKAVEAASSQAVTQANAASSSAADQTRRGLMRFGGDPNKMAYAMADLANQQALTQTGAANTAREAAKGKFEGLATGVANFGRNMPNTAGQAFGLATNAASSGVNSQNAAFGSGLPYAQYASGGVGAQLSAAGLQQQGALGMGGIMSRDYGTQMSHNASTSGGFGELLGTVAGAGLRGYMAR